MIKELKVVKVLAMQASDGWKSILGRWNHYYKDLKQKHV